MKNKNKNPNPNRETSLEVPSISEIFWNFFKLGLTGFGGPLALVSQMQIEFVQKKRWIEEKQFSQAFAMIKTLPGALAFSMATHIGQYARGFLGGLAAAMGLILPPFVMMIGLASLSKLHISHEGFYSVYHGLTITALFLIGLGIFNLIKSYLRDYQYYLGLLGSLILFYLNFPEPFVIVFMGILFCGIFFMKPNKLVMVFPAVDGLLLKSLAWTCFKSSAFVFGTGLAILPILQKEFTQVHEWVSFSDFQVAVTWGQVTPGPVLITATYLGFLVAGFTGGLVATASVFLANFLHMVTWFPYALSWMSKQKWIGFFIKGALSAVAISLFLSLWSLSQPFVAEIRNFILLAAIWALWLYKKPQAWILMITGGIIGLILGIK